MPRFSKQTLRENLMKRIRYYESEHGFDPSNGWAQVEPAHANDTQRRIIARAYTYGYYDALLSLWQELGEK